jgi:hypothetical protein
VLVLKVVELDAKLNSASNGDIFNGVIGQNTMIWAKMRYNHDPENENLRKSREFLKLKKIEEIKEVQGI